MGPRGMAVALVGSLFPLCLGTALACGFDYIYNGSLSSWRNYVSVGAAFAPSSMGIVLNVLRSSKALNTALGQLVVAAAILDDVLGLILLAELQAINKPSVINIVLPLISSPFLLLLFGFLAMNVLPKILTSILTRVSEGLREYVLLSLIFGVLLFMIPICHLAKTSHLLGAFLTGLLFCTEPSVHRVWTKQVKRLMQWLMRIFFGATIAFSVPVRQFGDREVILQALTLFLAMIGKLFVGIFAQPFSKIEFIKLALAVSTWGEFSFLLANACLGQTITKKQFASIILAVLLSILTVPYLLRQSLMYSNNAGKLKIEKCRKETGTSIGTGTKVTSADTKHIHCAYFVIDTKSLSHWAQQDELLHTIIDTLNLEIIDYRTWHEHHRADASIFNELYVKDSSLMLEPTKHLETHEMDSLKQRTKHIRKEIKRALRIDKENKNGRVIIKRWLPYIEQQNDHQDPQLRQETLSELFDPKKQSTNIKVTAYQQAGQAMQSSRINTIREHFEMWDSSQTLGNNNTKEFFKMMDRKLSSHNSISNLLSTVSRMHMYSDDEFNRHHLFDGLVHNDYHDLVAYFNASDEVEHNQIAYSSAHSSTEQTLDVNNITIEMNNSGDDAQTPKAVYAKTSKTPKNIHCIPEEQVCKLSDSHDGNGIGNQHDMLNRAVTFGSGYYGSSDNFNLTRVSSFSHANEPGKSVSVPVMYKLLDEILTHEGGATEPLTDSDDDERM